MLGKSIINKKKQNLFQFPSIFWYSNLIGTESSINVANPNIVTEVGRHATEQTDQ